ncbi:MAG TPA: hypothetical protein VJN94_08095 [Candidatus Binataceae bacterium]|nr:hypothetical protein [Candidatus Binataceae bacterium]
MIGEKTASRFVICGWIAALLLAISELLRAFIGSSRVDHFAIVDAVIFFALAYGISRRSRLATSIALAWWLIECTQLLVAGVGRHMMVQLVVFTVAFLLAIVGTFKLAANDQVRSLRAGAKA